MTVVVAFLDRSALMRWTPAVVATGVAVLIFAGGLTSGGSFNPARQLGPLLFAGRFSYLWAYLLGPSPGRSSSPRESGHWACRSRSPATCAAGHRATRH